jgi:hypothetical protein
MDSILFNFVRTLPCPHQRQIIRWKAKKVSKRLLKLL